jgi:hypothetical protein
MKVQVPSLLTLENYDFHTLLHMSHLPPNAFILKILPYMHKRLKRVCLLMKFTPSLFQAIKKHTYGVILTENNTHPYKQVISEPTMM